jgi:hypothetical protein
VLVALMLWLALAGGRAASAPSHPPSAAPRAATLAETEGEVFRFDEADQRWEAALRHRPLVAGDRIATGDEGRAVLRFGSTALRLAARTEVELLALSAFGVQVGVQRGSVALRVRSREAAEATTVATREVLLRVERSGHFRIDRRDDTTFAHAWQGELRIDDAQGFTIGAGRTAELWREPLRRSWRDDEREHDAARGLGLLRHAWTWSTDDAFGAWAQRAERDDERDLAATRHWLPWEVTGGEALAHHGRWHRHPEWGVLWQPVTVPPGWAPYRHGRWVWLSGVGWAWVDAAPWGFAPFHHGRWVWWSGGWAWAPGAHAGPPVFVPVPVFVGVAPPKPPPRPHPPVVIVPPPARELPPRRAPLPPVHPAAAAETPPRAVFTAPPAVVQVAPPVRRELAPAPAPAERAGERETLPPRRIAPAPVAAVPVPPAAAPPPPMPRPPVVATPPRPVFTAPPPPPPPPPPPAVVAAPPAPAVAPAPPAVPAPPRPLPPKFGGPREKTDER